MAPGPASLATTSPDSAPLRPARSWLRAAWPVAHVTIRVALAGIFLWAGFAKAFDTQGSTLSVDAYKVLPQALVRPMAVALPWVEIVLGLFLLLGLFVRVSGIGTALLSLMFLVAMSQAKARGLAIDCGCFGAGGTAGSGVSWLEILRDVPILLGSALLAWRPAGPLQLDRFLVGGGTT